MKYEVRGDATIIITARCCDDPVSESSHTEHDFEVLEQNVAAHLARVANTHKRRLAAEEKLKQLIAKQS